MQIKRSLKFAGPCRGAAPPKTLTNSPLFFRGRLLQLRERGEGGSLFTFVPLFGARDTPKLPAKETRPAFRGDGRTGGKKEKVPIESGEKIVFTDELLLLLPPRLAELNYKTQAESR